MWLEENRILELTDAGDMCRQYPVPDIYRGYTLDSALPLFLDAARRALLAEGCTFEEPLQIRVIKPVSAGP